MLGPSSTAARRTVSVRIRLIRVARAADRVELVHVPGAVDCKHPSPRCSRAIGVRSGRGRASRLVACPARGAAPSSRGRSSRSASSCAARAALASDGPLRAETATPRGLASRTRSAGRLRPLSAAPARGVDQGRRLVGSVRRPSHGTTGAGALVRRAAQHRAATCRARRPSPTSRSGSRSTTVESGLLWPHLERGGGARHPVVGTTKQTADVALASAAELPPVRSSASDGGSCDLSPRTSRSTASAVDAADACARSAAPASTRSPSSASGSRSPWRRSRSRTRCTRCSSAPGTLIRVPAPTSRSSCREHLAAHRPADRRSRPPGLELPATGAPALVVDGRASDPGTRIDVRPRVAATPASAVPVRRPSDGRGSRRRARRPTVRARVGGRVARVRSPRRLRVAGTLRGHRRRRIRARTLPALEALDGVRIVRRGARPRLPRADRRPARHRHDGREHRPGLVRPRRHRHDRRAHASRSPRCSPRCARRRTKLLLADGALLLARASRRCSGCATSSTRPRAAPSGRPAPASAATRRPLGRLRGSGRRGRARRVVASRPQRALRDVRADRADAAARRAARRAAALPARRLRLARLPLAAPARRHPRRRHGPRQDAADARADRAHARSGGDAAVPRRRADVGPVDLAERGRALHARTCGSRSSDATRAKRGSRSTDAAASADRRHHVVHAPAPRRARSSRRRVGGRSSSTRRSSSRTRQTKLHRAARDLQRRRDVRDHRHAAREQPDRAVGAAVAHRARAVPVRAAVPRGVRAADRAGQGAREPGGRRVPRGAARATAPPHPSARAAPHEGARRADLPPKQEQEVRDRARRPRTGRSTTPCCSGSGRRCSGSSTTSTATGSSSSAR